MGHFIPELRFWGIIFELHAGKQLATECEHEWPIRFVNKHCFISPYLFISLFLNWIDKNITKYINLDEKIFGKFRKLIWQPCPAGTRTSADLNFIATLRPTGFCLARHFLLEPGRKRPWLETAVRENVVELDGRWILAEIYKIVCFTNILQNLVN